MVDFSMGMFCCQTGFPSHPSHDHAVPLRRSDAALSVGEWRDGTVGGIRGNVMAETHANMRLTDYFSPFPLQKAALQMYPGNVCVPSLDSTGGQSTTLHGGYLRLFPRDCGASLFTSLGTQWSWSSAAVSGLRFCKAPCDISK